MLPFKKEKNEKYGLFLCGWHLNKNIMLIPEIINELKLLTPNFKIIITASPDNSKIYKKFKEKVDLLGVGEYISLIGNVKKEHLKSLYEQVDLIFLLSKLESFSNNIIEAWHFRKPLLISNEEWSRSICNDAAVYVDRLDARQIAKEAHSLFNNLEYQRDLIEKGMKETESYPSVYERTKQELSYVEEIKRIL